MIIQSGIYSVKSLSHITLPGPVRAVPGLFTGCFEQKSYIHSRGPHGPRAAPYEFRLPVRGPLSFNACIISLRARTGLDTSNSPWKPVWEPYGARTAKYDARARFLPILVVSIPLRVRNSFGHRTGPVGCPYGHHTGYPWSHANYSTKP